jgi:hypothetical protein
MAMSWRRLKQRSCPTKPPEIFELSLSELAKSEAAFQDGLAGKKCRDELAVSSAATCPTKLPEILEPSSSELTKSEAAVQVWPGRVKNVAMSWRCLQQRSCVSR